MAVVNRYCMRWPMHHAQDLHPSNRSNPVVKRFCDCHEMTAGDGCQLRELIHPDRDPASIRFSLAQAHVECGESTLRHALIQTELYYILEGKGTLFIDSKPYHVQKGDCVAVPPRSEQYLRNDGPSRLEFLCIVDPPWTEQGESVRPLP